MAKETLGSKYEGQTLQLGDIIEIVSTDSLNETQFFIQYIDKDQIDLLDQEGNSTVLSINKDGSLKNTSITQIILLSRNESPSFARQNNLLPGKWIDIHFGGELPTIITGKITALEEDQIEIKLTSDDIIYIDFEFKGIPKNLPITEIKIREKPSITEEAGMRETKEQESSPEVSSPEESSPEESSPEESSPEESSPEESSPEESGLESTPEDEVVIDETAADVFDTSQLKVEETIKELILEADAIDFGDDLGIVEQEVEVPESEMRFSIEKQATDMLNELLSTVPSANRTSKILNNIHTIIQRYKQLRAEYSTFDEKGNASKPPMKGATYKPLIKALKKLNINLPWILPVVRNKKKLYDLKEDESIDFDDYTDIIPTSTLSLYKDELEITKQFKGGNVPDGQNGYDYLNRRINPLYTPFDNPDGKTEDLISISVGTGLTTVVDNLDNMESSVAVNENISKKRFLIQKYNLGLNSLEKTKTRSGASITNVKVIIKPDTVYLKSFITLPLSTVYFSHINLPATDIMKKADLNLLYLDYWRLLNKKTQMTSEIIRADNPDIKFDERTYLKNVKEYVPEQGVKHDFTTYLDTIIPKTRVLFNLIKNNLKGELSLQKVLSALEPFLIYIKDLSFKQYEDITSFIKQKILDYNKRFGLTKKMYTRLAIMKVSNPTIKFLTSILRSKPDLYSNFSKYYNISIDDLDDMTDTELLIKLNEIDFGNFYSNMVASISTELMLPELGDKLRDTEEWLSKYNEANESRQQQKCEKYVLSKKYYTLSELLTDNDKDIYFDSEFDKTFYDVIDEYKSGLEAFTTDAEKISYLSGKLMENVGMNTEDALREADSLINKRKLIKKGDYAILVDDPDPQKIKYYKRTDDKKWELDSRLKRLGAATDNTLFCNISEACIEIKANCDSIDKAKLDVEKDNIKDILNEFSDELKDKVKNIEEHIRNQTANNMRRLLPLLMQKSEYFQASDKIKYNLGLDSNEVIVERSPHADLFDLIIGQSDFVKRQHDISKFVIHYTRAANPDEDKWWLYCNKTNIQLVPTFLARLANAFIQNNNYFELLQKIATDQGILSGDGDAIIDKYSGRVITHIGFSTDEGFTEEGYVAKSRDVIESDMGEVLVQALMTAEERVDQGKMLYDTEPQKTIYSVITAIGNKLGLNLDDIEEFIMRETYTAFSKDIISETRYNNKLKTIKNKKNIETYQNYYNKTLLLYTISLILIGIQTSIPSMTTRKTVPSCKKSFSGYPLGSDADMTGIIYIVCVAKTLSTSKSITPWNAIQRLKPDSLMEKIKALIDLKLLDLPIIKSKIHHKKVYNKQNKDVFIPDELDIKNWTTFLPPLQNVEIKSVTPFSKEFRDQLKTDLLRGNKEQYNKILALRSKIIYIALSIETSIQKVVIDDILENNAILSSALNTPFLENACCDEDEVQTDAYFVVREPSIKTDVDMARNIEDLLYDIELLSRASILFDPNDTKTLYPKLENVFSEDTIYKAFIHFCRFNSNLPVKDSLKAICSTKPESYNKYADMNEIIENMKREGIQYDTKTLNRLMGIVNKENILDVRLNDIFISNIQKIKNLLNEIDEDEDIDEDYEDADAGDADTEDGSGSGKGASAISGPVPGSGPGAMSSPGLDGDGTPRDIVPQKFKDLFLKSIDNEDNVRDFKNYLGTSSQFMTEELSKFIKNYRSKKKLAFFVDCIKDIDAFNFDDISKKTNSLMNNIFLLTKVLPNIIINSVDFAISGLLPKHWNLSNIHYKDISSSISAYYHYLQQYYKDKKVKKALEIYVKRINIFYELSRVTIYTENSLFDKNLVLDLFKFYFLSILTELMMLSNNKVFYQLVITPSSDSIGSEERKLEEVEGEDEDEGVVEDILIGNKAEIEELVANMMISFMEIICSNKKYINFNYEMLKERITRAKEREKDKMVRYLTELTIEERAVENTLKNHRLGKWSVGMQKGFRVYDKDTYDRESKEHFDDDKRVFMSKLSKITEEIGVTAANIDEIEQEQRAQEIEKEEYDMTEIGEDNDGYGETDDADGY